LLAFFPYVRRHGTLDVLEVLPSRDPVIALAAFVALFEYGEGLAEVVAVDVVEDLPKDLTILELVPRVYSAGQVEGVDL
jgi:hypothetical protein